MATMNATDKFDMLDKAGKGAQKTGVEHKTITTARKNIDAIRMNSNGEVTIAEAEIQLATGETLKDPNKRAFNTATLKFNLGDMTAEDPDHPGSTQNHTPVTVHIQEDGRKKTAAFEIDPTAVANASYDKQRAVREAEGRLTAQDKKYSDPLKDPARDRITIEQTFTTTQNGLAGTSVKGVKENVAKIANSDYLLSAGSKTKEDPSIGAYTKANIDNVAKIYTTEFNKFIKNAVSNDGAGISARDSSGKKTGEVIEGTAFSALDKYGVKLIEANGAMVLAMPSEYDAKTSPVVNGMTLGQNLAAMSNAFNASFKQYISGTNKQGEPNIPDKSELKLLSEMKSSMYPVSMYDVSDSEVPGVTLIQPAITAKMQPFAASVVKANQVATHSYAMVIDGQTIEDATPAQAYGEGVIAKANEILAMGKKDQISSEKAIENKTAQIEAIMAELGDDQQMSK